MCGITGHVAAGTSRDEAAVRRMNAALAHRGPDAEGVWGSGRATLGHRRLSIIDLSPEANQPLANETGTVAVVVNGEIYNFVELRRDLVARGHVFRSRSDSEVIVHLYEEYGTGCLAKLDGMFAFALWDAEKERLVLARDRAGKKPLFYRLFPDGAIAFASEIHALVRAFPDAAPAPNLAGIDEYLTLQYVPSPHTAFKGVFKVPAAHALVFERGKPVSEERYWQKPRGAELSVSEDEAARMLREALDRAVRKRLVSDVPLGAFLSGGIDSTAIVGLMATALGRPLKTFSIGFPDAADDELPWARMVAERYRTDHHEEIVTPVIADVLAESVRHHGEPFADSSAIATYCLARMTRQHVTVALSGDGSDEAFAGYTRYRTARLAHLYDALPTKLREPYRLACAGIARAFVPHMQGFVSHFGDGEAVRYPYIMCQFTSEEKRALFSAGMRDAMTTATTERFDRLLAESPRPSALGRLIDLDWQTYLVDDINTKVDIASMAHGLEVRCPFLDTAVTELAAVLPARMLQRVRGKHVLRRAVKDLVPAPILRRRKRGFGLPIRRWIRSDLRAFTRDVLLDKKARERGLFEVREVERLLSAVDRDWNAADRVWTLLVLELWFREFVDRAG